jgi:hypothetical protein
MRRDLRNFRHLKHLARRPGLGSTSFRRQRAWHPHAPGGPAGVLAGFADLAEPALEQAVRRLADAAADISLR